MVEEKLEVLTIILIFIMIVLNQIFLIAITIALCKKVRNVMKTKVKSFYLMIMFYIVSKMVLIVIMEIKIIAGLSNDWENLTADLIEEYFKNVMVMADISIIELFLISFQYYMGQSFSLLFEFVRKLLYRTSPKSFEIFLFSLKLPPSLL